MYHYKYKLMRQIRMYKDLKHSSTITLIWLVPLCVYVHAHICMLYSCVYVRSLFPVKDVTVKGLGIVEVHFPLFL